MLEDSIVRDVHVASSIWGCFSSCFIRTSVIVERKCSYLDVPHSSIGNFCRFSISLSASVLEMIGAENENVFSASLISILRVSCSFSTVCGVGTGKHETEKSKIRKSMRSHRSGDNC